MGRTERFAVAIIAEREDAGIVDYAVQGYNSGIEEESVITILRNWLRAFEEQNYKNFTGRQPPKD